METLTLRVEGMTCGHCKAAVTEALRQVSGVTAAEVDLEHKLAKVTFVAGQTHLTALKAAVEAEGYQVPGTV